MPADAYLVYSSTSVLWNEFLNTQNMLLIDFSFYASFIRIFNFISLYLYFFLKSFPWSKGLKHKSVRGPQTNKNPSAGGNTLEVRSAWDNISIKIQVIWLMTRATQVHFVFETPAVEV